MLGDFTSTIAATRDDDLTSVIDPYQVFRIFHEIHFLRVGNCKRADIAYMVDQDHNLKGKIEEGRSTRDDGPGTFSRRLQFVDGRELATAAN